MLFPLISDRDLSQLTVVFNLVACCVHVLELFSHGSSVASFFCIFNRLSNSFDIVLIFGPILCNLMFVFSDVFLFGI